MVKYHLCFIKFLIVKELASFFILVLKLRAKTQVKFEDIYIYIYNVKKL